MAIACRSFNVWNLAVLHAVLGGFCAACFVNVIWKRRCRHAQEYDLNPELRAMLSSITILLIIFTVGYIIVVNALPFLPLAAKTDQKTIQSIVNLQKTIVPSMVGLVAITVYPGNPELIISIISSIRPHK